MEVPCVEIFPGLCLTAVQIALLALVLSFASLVISGLHVLWTILRPYRKLVIKASFINMAEHDPDLGLSLKVVVRNARKVPIGMRAWGVQVKDARGSERSVSFQLFYDPTKLEEGDELTHIWPVEPDVAEIDFVYVADRSGKLWKRTRIGNQRLFRDWVRESLSEPQRSSHELD